MKLVAVLTLLISCYGVIAYPLEEISRHDVGPKECAHGPEYWCQNLQTAKNCGAVKHCIQNVWQHIKLANDESDICETCKKMVAEARAQLESNETQEEIRQVLEGTCRIYFPIKTLAEECIKYVDEFVPELVEMLASRMDPQLVCATAGLCNTQILKLRLSKEKLQKRLPGPSDCQDCNKFMQDINKDIENATQDDIKKKLLDVCSHMAQYSQACHILVVNNFDEIYTFLREMNPSEVCQLIGMCDEITKIPMITSVVELFVLKSDPDPECEFCEQMVQYLKNLIIANSTEEEVKELLLGLCKHFGKLADQCEAFVNDNFQEIYDFLTDELDPHEICNALGICKNSTSVPMTLLMTSIKKDTPQGNTLFFKPQLESNDIDDAPFAQKQKPAMPPTDTADKKILTKFPFSKTPQVQVEAENMQLPETRLFPQSLLATGFKPTCALCEYALHELQNILMDNKTVDAIEKAIDGLCSHLPQTLIDECTNFVEEYGASILALLAQEIDPSQVCTALKLCDGQLKVNSIAAAGTVVPLDKSQMQLPPSRLMPNLLAKSVKSDSCQLCQYIMGIVHTMLRENKTREAIEDALKNACSELPDSMQSQCKAFIDKYGEELLSLLQHMDPSAICAILKLCSSKTAQVIVPIKELKMNRCEVCQMIVDYVDKLLEEQAVDEDITLVLEKVCGIVPKSAQPQCQTVIDTYGPYVLQLLGQMADSNKICQAIDLCTPPAGEVHLLGGKKCTYGPSYWCQNKFNARACKAEQHCKDFVWKN